MDVIEYAQSLGYARQNGLYRVAALDDDGEILDEGRIDFRCQRAFEEASAVFIRKNSNRI